MSTHRITIDLADGSYELLRRAVESGRYASESEAIQDVIDDLRYEEPLREGTPAFERWMREVVLPADDELESDASTGLTPEQLRESLGLAPRTGAK